MLEILLTICTSECQNTVLLSEIMLFYIGHINITTCVMFNLKHLSEIAFDLVTIKNKECVKY